jgi:hypothetical protein
MLMKNVKVAGKFDSSHEKVKELLSKLHCSNSNFQQFPLKFIDFSIAPQNRLFIFSKTPQLIKNIFTPPICYCFESLDISSNSLTFIDAADQITEFSSHFHSPNSFFIDRVQRLTVVITQWLNSV